MEIPEVGQKWQEKSGWKRIVNIDIVQGRSIGISYPNSPDRDKLISLSSLLTKYKRRKDLE